MSDAVKAQKLAAARKKLKEFQQKTKNVAKKEHINTTSDVAETEKVESLTSSTCSSLNGQFVAQPDNSHLAVEKPANFPKHQDEYDGDIQRMKSENFTIECELQAQQAESVPRLDVGPCEEVKPNLPIYNYFSNAGYDSAYNDRNNFFDNIGESGSEPDHLAPKLTDNSNDSGHGLYNTAVYLDNNLYSTPHMFNISGNEAQVVGNPDFKLSDLYDNVQKNTVTEENSIEMNNYLQNERNEYFTEKDDKQDTDMLQEISDWNTNEPPKKKPDDNNSETPHSNVESLLQLSSQIAQLIEPDSEYEVQQPIADLENRNQLLAALLEEERLKSEQLNAQLQINVNRRLQLENELEQVRLDSETALTTETGPLREQLQQHIQSVGVLVAEKTELSAMLKQSQANVKQKMGECEELRARLKTSRSRVADLEREFGELKVSQGKSNASEGYDKLNLECTKMKEMNEELSQDILELQAKLQVSEAENLKLREEIQAATSKLDLAEIKIHQLTAGRDIHVDTQVEQLTQEKLLLEKQLSDANNSLKVATKERDQANSQFQQHVQQLNFQLNSFVNQLEVANKENESLRTREQNLVAHIGEMEKVLSNLQNEHASVKGSGELRKELDGAFMTIQMLENDKAAMQENFTRVSNERDMLLKDLDAKKESILELESLIERLRGNQPDTSKLLAEIESDKVAAARAVTQNGELKKQLQDIQDDFIKMSNDKLSLTEQLTSEQHVNKDLKEKLQHTEIQLQMLAEAIEIKDRELTNIRDFSEELNKQVLQQDQLTDRLRHYEAQDNSSQSIQVELQQARQLIENLTAENSKFRHELHVLRTKREESGVETTSEEKETDGNNQNETNENPNDTDTLNKEVATKQLEEKFLKTMQDIANLTDEKQRLEHIVLQLQGETETIGEYIALYQHQRGVLQQRAFEKDEQLKQLAADREQMRNKLEQLNSLVRKLVLAKGALSSEILARHEELSGRNEGLCEEHARVHQEVSRGAHERSGVEAGEEVETAEKIIALLSEIKTSNLIQPSEKFHPCPWCSGKLITV